MFYETEVCPLLSETEVCPYFVKMGYDLDFFMKLRCVPLLLARLNKASDYVMVLSTSHFASLKCVVQGFNLDSAPSVEPPPLAGLKDRSDSEVAEGD